MQNFFYDNIIGTLARQDKKNGKLYDTLERNYEKLARFCHVGT